MQDDAQQERGHEPINDVQRLQLELLRRVHHNLFDGAKVVDDLLAWRDHWYGVIADRCAASTGNLYEPVVDLIRLRDIPRNYWNVDCVFIWTNEANAERLRRMIEERWQADMVELLAHDEAVRGLGWMRGKGDCVLYVWWD